jgi:hypothetical protein
MRSWPWVPGAACPPARPPGAPPRQFGSIAAADGPYRRLTDAEIAHLKAEWDRANSGARPVYLIPDGCTLSSVFEDRQWPDAEFCAA